MTYTPPTTCDVCGSDDHSYVVHVTMVLHVPSASLFVTNGRTIAELLQWMEQYPPDAEFGIITDPLMTMV